MQEEKKPWYKFLITPAVIILAMIGIFVAMNILATTAFSDSRHPGLYSEVIQVSGEPAEIFSWVSDESKLRQWQKGYRSTTKLTNTDMDVIIPGDRFEDRVGRKTIIREIISYEPNKKISFTGIGIGFQYTGEYVFTDIGDKTEISYKAVKRYTKSLGQAFEPTLTFINQRRLSKDFENLEFLIQSRSQ